MKNPWLSAVITFIFLAALASSMALGIITERDNTAEPPELNVGNWWAYEQTYSWEGGQRRISERMEVTGNSGDTWQLAVSMEPLTDFDDPRFTIEAIDEEIAKATLLTILREQRGMTPWLEDLELVRPYSQFTTYSYEFPDGSLWPLSVGKKVRMIQSSYEQTEYTDTGEITNRHSSTLVYTYEVEKMESVTVPAGTFHCFKVLRYIEGLDTNIRAEWYSPDVMNNVKTTETTRIDEFEQTYTEEMKSYSLSA